MNLENNNYYETYCEIIMNFIDGNRKYYNIGQVCSILNLSRTTLSKLIKEKKICCTGNGGRGGYKVTKNTIELYAKENNILPNWNIGGDINISWINKQDVELVIEYKKNVLDELETRLEELINGGNFKYDEIIKYRRKIIELKIDLNICNKYLKHNF